MLARRREYRLAHGAAAGTPQRIQAAVHCALLDAGAVPPPITVTPVDGIDREPGHAAKFKVVKVEGGQ